MLRQFSILLYCVQRLCWLPEANLEPSKINPSSIWLKKSKLVTSNRSNLENKPETEALCIDMLSWITKDEDLMLRFLALSGLEADTMRDAAGEPGFLAGVVNFLMGHEPTLMAYCEARGIAPEQVVAAWHDLGESSAFENSI